jgi:hypothetical protein
MRKRATILTVGQFFGGQAAGQAISDTIFGVSNPGGRVPLSVPYDVGTMPVYYKYLNC